MNGFLYKENKQLQKSVHNFVTDTGKRPDSCIILC